MIFQVVDERESKLNKLKKMIETFKEESV